MGMQLVRQMGCLSKAIQELTEQVVADNRIAVTLPEVCVKVDGIAEFAYPVNIVDSVTLEVIEKKWFSIDGNIIKGNVVQAEPCDCDCETCSCDHCILVDGWDSYLDESQIKEGSDSGSLMPFKITVDDIVLANLNIDYFASSDHVNKSTWYTELNDYLNANVNDLSVTLVDDADANKTDDMPQWRYSYTGCKPLVLEIAKGSDERVITLSFDGNGNIETKHNWDAEGSEPFSECK